MGELEDAMGQLQAHNQQLQGIAAQKQAYIIQLNEIEKALEYLKNSSGKKIYRAVGSIIIESSLEGVKKELEEQKEDAELRVKTLESHEEKAKKKMKESHDRFEKLAEQRGSAAE
ncbi:MAG: prefoldin subunit beta [Candidatus Aenigmarchaeota archaeon]|nr:prefoldin subunit beta [Candidatus Aenigmarchaeota archaeon]